LGERAEARAYAVFTSDLLLRKAGHHKKGGLPDISYISGGLENPEIRKQVCEILEGAKAAFVERAKRLRIMI
jgi:hypothetical protein